MPFSRREIWAGMSLASIENCVVVEVFVPRHRLDDAYAEIKRNGWRIITDQPDTDDRNRLAIGGKKDTLLRFAEFCRRGMPRVVREDVLVH
jgi:hypothetical protein